MAATVELIRVGGGTTALVAVFSKFANTRPKSFGWNMVCWSDCFLMIMPINLIVGSSMQPLPMRKRFRENSLTSLIVLRHLYNFSIGKHVDRI